MSGETIRDVVIRISLAAGDLSAAKSVAKNIKDALEGAGSGNGNINRPVSDPERSSKSADTAAAKSIAMVEKQASAKQRADERAAAAAERAYDREAQAAIKSYSKIMAERKRAADDAEKQADREAAAAIKSYSRIMAERRRDENRASADKIKDLAEQQAKRANLLQGAKGLAFSAASMNPDTGAMAHQIVAAEGAYQSLAAVVQGTGVTITAGMVTITAVAAAAAAAFLGVRQSVIATREETARWRQSMAEDSQSVAKYLGETAVRHGQQAVTAVQSMPDISSSNRQVSVIERREQLEQSIRGEQAASGRDYSHRQEIRSRRERMHGLGEAKTENQDQIAFADKKQAELDERRKKFELDRVNSAASHVANIKALQATKRDPDLPVQKHAGLLSDPRGWMRQTMGAAWRRGAGLETPQQRAAHNKGVDQQINDASVNRGEDLKKEKSEQIQIDRESLQISQQKQEAAANILKVTREQVAAAREAAEADQQRVTAANIQFGLMSKGEQNRLKRIDKKSERIEQQRAANKAAGRDEFAGVEKFTHAELRFGAGTDGPLGQAIRDQAEHEGENRGVRTYSKRRDESKAELAKVEAAQVQESPDNKKIVADQAAQNQKLADEIVQGFREAFSLEDLKAKFEQAGKEMKRQFEEWKLQQNSWF